MSKANKHSGKLDANRFRQYLNKRMSEKEENAFERELLQTDFEYEAMQGLSKLSPEELDADLGKLSERLRPKVIPLWRRPAVMVAASLLLVIGIISTMQLLTEDKTVLVTEAQHEKMQKKITLESVESTEETKLIEEQALDLPEEEETTTLQAKKIESEPIPNDNIETTVVAKAELKSDRQGQAGGVADKLEQKIVQVEKVELPKLSIKSTVEKRERSVPVRMKSGSYSAKSVEEKQFITGVVYDAEDKKPIPGANIYVKGTTKGVVTDLDGQFKLSLNPTDSNQTLLVDFIGYEQIEHQISGDSLSFYMKSDQLALDEVVVVGYGVSKREEPEPVSERARPIEGMRKFIRNIEEQLVYPADGTGKKEVVTCKVTISKKGTLHSIFAIKSPGQSYTNEMKRVLLKSPKWKPAHRGDFITEDVVRIRLVFHPEKR